MEIIKSLLEEAQHNVNAVKNIPHLEESYQYYKGRLDALRDIIRILEDGH